MGRSTIRKLLLLASTAAHQSGDFLDRMMIIGERAVDRVSFRRADYRPSLYCESLRALGASLGKPLEPFLAEAAFQAVQNHIVRFSESLTKHAPFTLQHNADTSLARTCYALVRALRPAAVVETGVAYGITSTVILAALRANGVGRLYSIDLPPLGKDADMYVGALVPSELKERWQLHRGLSRRVLPPLLAQVGEVGLFVHDSLHTYSNISRELETVMPYLSSTSVVVVDDIDKNAAFQEWVLATRPAYSAAVQQIEKPGLFGVSLYL